MSVGVVNIPALGEIVSAAKGMRMFFEWRAGASFETSELERCAVVVHRFRGVCALWLWTSGGIAASTREDESHVGRLLWVCAGRNWSRRRDARSGDEPVGLRAVVADHGRGGRNVY